MFTIPGVLQTTLNDYNIEPWSQLEPDVVDTMIDYYTIILGPGYFNYSISYGNENRSVAAICELGNFLIKDF